MMQRSQGSDTTPRWKDRKLAPASRIKALLRAQGPLPLDVIQQVFPSIQLIEQVLLDMVRAERLSFDEDTGCYDISKRDDTSKEKDDTAQSETANDAEVKPCPFCGCKDVVIDEPNTEHCVVRCDNCNAMVTCPAYRVKPVYTKETINEWNARA